MSVWCLNKDGSIDWKEYNRTFPPAHVTPEHKAKLLLLEMHVAVNTGTGRLFIIRYSNGLPFDSLMSQTWPKSVAYFDTVDEALNAVFDKDNYTWR